MSDEPVVTRENSRIASTGRRTVQGETILCVANRVWDSLWRDSQQIMSRIAKHNRVLYFEPGRNPDKSHLAEMWHNWPNFFSLHLRRLHENLIILSTPACLPYARRHLPRSVLQITTPIVARLNARILSRHVRRAMQKLDVRRPILWLYEPRHVYLVGQFDEKVACYFNYDELADFVDNTRIKELLREYDRRLCRAADVVLATSRSQWRRRLPFNPNTIFVPNGVDFALFNCALEPELPLPEDIRSVPGPIIGFAGWLGYHIDVGLLLRIAQTYPDASLVLVGPDELPDSHEKERLHACPNVYFLGQKKRRELPNYLQAFDVALMPYLLTGHILSAYPLKLHEYLAAGRSIIAMALPELQPFHDVVRIAEDHDAFLQQIREALYDDAYTNDTEAVERRVAIARENTWDHRVTDIYRALAPLL